MAFTSEIDKLERRWNENPLGLTFAPYAEACRKAGDFAKALELLEKGLAQHPNYVPAHIVRGRCHLDIQSDADAEQAFLRAVELDPENVIALKSLAELSERAGRLPEAIRRLEQLLDVDRNNEEAREQLERVRELQAAPPPVQVPSEETAPEVPVHGEALEEPHAIAPDAGGEVENYGEPAMIELVPFEPEHSASAVRNEWQVSNDSEAIRANEAPMGDIVLGADPPDFPPSYPAALPHDASPEPVAESVPLAPLVTESDQPIVDVLPPPPAVDEMAETILPPPPTLPAPLEAMALEPEPETLAEPEPHPAPEPEPMPALELSSEPDGSPTPAPVLEEMAPPEPAMEPEQVQEAESAHAQESVPEPESAHEPESVHEPLAAVPEPELVVTESMAEVFLRQGYRELARAVYLQLAERDPSDTRVAAALAALQPEAPSPQAPSAPPPAPEPQFDARSTGGRSVHQLFASILAATRPASAATVHPPAFEAPRRPSGEPTRPAQESLSLSAVFGEEAAPAESAGGAAPAADGEPSFDEFYAAQGGSGGSSDLPAGPASAPPADSATAPEDLEQFNAWLRGLKR